MSRPVSKNDETTRQPARQKQQAKDPSTTLLTVLSHPDPRRIGERAALLGFSRGEAIDLERHSPRFSPIGSPWNDRPLDDVYLSRKPWTLRATESGLELVRGRSSTELRLDGVLVDEVALVSRDRLDLGVTLELSDRIALLLHQMPESLVTAAESEPPSREMVGASAGILKVRESVQRVADLDVPVLIRGESGTGKELIAGALHRRSRRASEPFVAVDLGVLSPHLAASELFGHVKGAFTGAQSARPGFFRAADGGTLFLDEVGEATAEVQAMLLRVLETRQVVPVGSHVPIPVDVRLIAATDSDLVARARRGDFKEPLIHRLAAYVVEPPPLRERRDDLGRLFIHLAQPVLRELGEEHLLAPPDLDGPPWLPAGLAARLARESWSGNVRQLANVVRQLVIDSRGREQLRDGPLLARLDLEASQSAKNETELPALSLPTTPDTTIPSAADEGSFPVEPTDAPSAEGEPDDPERYAYRHPSEVTEAEISDAMVASGYEPAVAARLLNVSRPSFYKLVRESSSVRLAPDIPPEELEEALNAVDGDMTDAAHRLGVSRRALSRRLTQLGLHREDAHEL